MGGFVMLAYVLDIVLKNSFLIFFYYMCFATIALCIAYFINEEAQRILHEKREQRELELRRTGADIDPVVDELYQS
jgi:hypothetical protein